MLEAVMTFFGTVLLGMVGWVFSTVTNLGSRVSVVESQADSLKELIEARFDNVDGRLDRIERSMNGHLIKD